MKKVVFSQNVEFMGYPLISKQQLIDFCVGKNITKELYEEMELNLVLGADLLTELVAIGETQHKYIQYLLRIKKLERILEEWK